MMNIRAFAIKILLLSLSAYPIYSLAECTGGGTRPIWVDSPESATHEYFFAAGVSDNTRLALADRIASAKQNAIKNLSETIQVSIKNSLILEESQRKNDGRVLSDSNYTSITETSTSASLKSVEIIATWEDPKSCAIWLRARVSTQHVEQGKREGLTKVLFEILNTQLAIAQNSLLSLNDRMSAVNAALDTLPRISLQLIPEANSANFYNQLLSSIQKELLQSQNDLEQAKNILNTSAQLINEATRQTDEIAKAKQLESATKNYKGLLAKYNNGLQPLFATGDIYFKLGEIEETRGNSCGAKNYYLQSAESKHLNDGQLLARKRSETLACSAEDMEKTLWRQRFEGKSTTIICYYVSNLEQGIWNKACDDVNNIIRPLGADTSIQMKKLTPTQLKELKNGEIPASFNAKGKVFVGVFSSGKMINRIDKESPGKNREYQFEGSMATFLVEDGKTIFSDRFQGKTGWNPVSSQMVLDVLAINVVKRWKEKFSKFLKHELE